MFLILSILPQIFASCKQHIPVILITRHCWDYDWELSSPKSLNIELHLIRHIILYSYIKYYWYWFRLFLSNWSFGFNFGNSLNMSILNMMNLPLIIGYVPQAIIHVCVCVCVGLKEFQPWARIHGSNHTPALMRVFGQLHTEAAVYQFAGSLPCKQLVKTCFYSCCFLAFLWRYGHQALYACSIRKLQDAWSGELALVLILEETKHCLYLKGCLVETGPSNCLDLFELCFWTVVSMTWTKSKGLPMLPKVL